MGRELPVSHNRRGVLYAAAGLVAMGHLVVWALAKWPDEEPGRPLIVPVAVSSVVTPAHVVSVAGGQGETAEGLLALAERDPEALVARGHERYEREVRDYRCVLLKQERVEGVLLPAEEVEVRFRQTPLAIYMIWRQNASQAKRVLFKDDPAFIDGEGNKLARAEPAGAVVRLFVRDIFMPINGEHARRASRRTIDECGFGPIFDLWERYNAKARAEGVLDVRFGGVGEVDGRPTFIVIRRLPYSGEGGAYPDAKLVMHLDQEWLLPVAIESYADESGQELLGRYVFTQVELNPGLTEADFEF